MLFFGGIVAYVRRARSPSDGRSGTRDPQERKARDTARRARRLGDPQVSPRSSRGEPDFRTRLPARDHPMRNLTQGRRGNDDPLRGSLRSFEFPDLVRASCTLFSCALFRSALFSGTLFRRWQSFQVPACVDYLNV
jgi:hypothetical protein